MTDQPGELDEVDEDPVVALVLLRSASGRTTGPGDVVTAADAAASAPDPAAAQDLVGALRERGLVVGPVVGPTTSITAPRAVFERVFGVEVARLDDGTWTVRTDDRGPGSTSVPLDALDLDPAMAATVDAIVFEPPVDLHDTPAL